MRRGNVCAEARHLTPEIINPQNECPSVPVRAARSLAYRWRPAEGPNLGRCREEARHRMSNTRRKVVVYGAAMKRDTALMAAPAGSSALLATGIAARQHVRRNEAYGSSA